ncbi:hypothetical protein EBQ90_01390, partial [bacterium]|nr:hypothetical protein [bacterium]
RELIVNNYNRGVEILQNKIAILHAMAAALLERETLERAEIEALMEGKTLPALPVAGEPSRGASERGSGEEAAHISLPLPGQTSEVA